MSKQILVVDDNPVIIRLVSEIIKKQGYSVRCAEDGLSAVNILEEYIPDIIFVDLVLPKISGEKLCQIIRSKVQFKDVYIIILSGIAVEAELDLNQLGVDACIAKGKNIATHISAVLNKIENRVLRNEQSKVYGFEDVFVRKSTVELLDSKKHLEVILANLSDGLVEVTTEGTIIFANHAAESLFSTPQAQLLGSNFFKFFQGEDYHNAVSLFESAQLGSQPANEVRHLSLKKRFLTLNILPLEDIPYPSCIIIMHDITVRKQLEEELKLLSTTDQLTGAYNRRAFEDFFTRERSRAKRYNIPLSLIIFDIDHFKKVNDTFGHDAGDHVLQEVVDMSKKQIRQIDFLCRWGGEEFVLLLPETGIESAQIVAERLRSTVEKLEFSIPSNITISFGLSQFHTSDSPETLIKRADIALYEAKQDGRNRVAVIPY